MLWFYLLTCALVAVQAQGAIQTNVGDKQLKSFNINRTIQQSTDKQSIRFDPASGFRSFKQKNISVGCI